MAGAQADIHTKILTASTTEELMGIYDNWAQGYETQLLDEWGYTSPQTAVKLLASAMPLEGVHGVDAGCGERGEVEESVWGVRVYGSAAAFELGTSA